MARNWLNSGVNIKHKPKISAYVRQRAIDSLPNVHILLEKKPEVTDLFAVTIDEIIHSFPKSFSERVNRVLLNLSKLSAFTGSYIDVSEQSTAIFYSDSYDMKSLLYMLKFLLEENYIEKRGSDSIPTLPSEIRLSPKGWEKTIQLESGSSVLAKQVFIAMWFNESVQSAFSEGIYKAIEDTGYVPVRIDYKEHNEKICDLIIAEIRKSKFVVCDFTGHRGGVYFEAGYAMGLGKPVIWTCRESDIGEAHFDTRQYNHIVWKDERDLYSKLYRRIQATIV